MWTRKEVKERGKLRFTANYWKCVLVALILAVIVGNAPTINSVFDVDDFGDEISSYSYKLNHDIDNYVYSHENHSYSSNDIEELIDIFEEASFMAPLLGIIVAIGSVVAVGSICLKIFLFNPLELGCKSFFVKNLEEDAGFGYLGNGFSKNYLNGVLVLFLRDLFNFLWFLLFIIPGIVKAYEYRMIPYLLAENPDMSREEAFATSKEMMMGNKWSAFVLDLSFIGWEILSALTLGILGVFYVNPYIYETDAALYEKLANKTTPVSAEASYIEVE